MRKILALTLGIIGISTLIIWAISQFIQPILPSRYNSVGILFFAALTSVIAAIAGIKDIIELIERFMKNDNTSKNPIVSVSSSESIVVQTILSHREPVSESSEVLHNLPQPNYGEFVGREDELRKLVELLRPYPFSQDSRITISGIGGVGKTTLALEAGHRYLRSFGDLDESERFEVIVWTSAKDRILTADGIFSRHQNTQSIQDVISSIADVSKIEIKPRHSLYSRVVSTLSTKRTLLIIDNYETIDDEAILMFIQELPAPTKLLVTTRHKIDIGSFTIPLIGLSKDDGLTLINKECVRKQVDLDDDSKERLYIRTGGIPLAIVLSIT